MANAAPSGLKDLRDILKEDDITKCEPTSYGFKITTKNGVYKLKQKEKGKNKVVNFLQKKFKKKKDKSKPLREAWYSTTDVSYQPAEYLDNFEIGGRYYVNETSQANPSIAQYYYSPMHLYLDLKNRKGSRKGSRALPHIYQVKDDSSDEDVEIYEALPVMNTEELYEANSGEEEDANEGYEPVALDDFEVLYIPWELSEMKSSPSAPPPPLPKRHNDHVKDSTVSAVHESMIYAKKQPKEVQYRRCTQIREHDGIGSNNAVIDSGVDKSEHFRNSTHSIVQRDDGNVFPDESIHQINDEDNPTISSSCPISDGISSATPSREQRLLKLYDVINSTYVPLKQKQTDEDSSNKMEPLDIVLKDNGAANGDSEREENSLQNQEIVTHIEQPLADLKLSPSTSVRETSFQQLYTKLKSNEKVPYDDMLVVDGQKYGSHEELLDAILESEDSLQSDDCDYYNVMHGYG